MQFNFDGKTYHAQYWSPSDGAIGEVLAFDTETEPITPGNIPGLVLGQAYAEDGPVWLIKLQYLKDFVTSHADATLVMHNAPFDISVVEKEVGFDFDPQIRGERLFDTMLLFPLWRLATVGSVGHAWSLDTVTRHLLGIQIAKEDAVRCGFGQHRQGINVDYDSISEEKIRYAAVDAIVTLKNYQILRGRIDKLDCRYDLSHKIQLMGAYGLYLTSLRGIGFDLARRQIFIDKIDEAIAAAKKVLSDFGYTPGEKGVKAAFAKIAAENKIDLPLTPKGKVSSKAEYLEPYRGQNPFVDAYLNYQDFTKQKSFVDKLATGRIHTRFRYLLNSGRTSSSSPNIQNLPRKSGVRECFIPAAGKCFIRIDYSQLELRTLAQVCLNRFGFSKMAELINSGLDLHKWFASLITGKSENELTKSERNAAKAANFGYPAGLGIPMFVQYAKQTFRVELTEDRARELKEQWLDAFPEMRLYLKDTLSERYDFSTLDGCDNAEIACALFKRIIGGETCSRAGHNYSQKLIEWAFEDVLTAIAPSYSGVHDGSPELLRKVCLESIETSTGRIRANATYCQVRNAPFQGLAADGCKIALYYLIRAGYRVVNFIHDEFIVEVPLECNLKSEGERIKDIVVSSMRKVVPDVQIDAEWGASDRWYKESKLIYDEYGNVVICTEENKERWDQK